LIREKPDRWHDVWGPFAVFISVALFQMNADVRNKGAELSAGIDFSFARLD
jgi:hypothetical protein